MNKRGKERAAKVARDAMEARGWSYGDVAEQAGIPDPATVREFMAGERWPWPQTRGKLESALGLPDGALEEAATARSDDEHDPLLWAIANHPQLSRADKSELETHYFRLLEARDRSVG